MLEWREEELGSYVTTRTIRYREVPQATLGFNPFKLLYGRDVRGPLDVLKEE